MKRKYDSLDPRNFIDECSGTVIVNDELSISSVGDKIKEEAVDAD